MSAREYIGARYVPLFAEPLNWDITKTYEPLTIVLHQGNSYTSRQAVPAGIDITNELFWANTGNYNAQIEQYRGEVTVLGERVTNNATAISDETTARQNEDTAINNKIGAGFDSTDTVAKAIDEEATARQNADDAIMELINESKIKSGFFTHLGSIGRRVSRMQGGCYIGNNIFVQCITDNKLLKFNVIDGTEIAESNSLPLGHCNSLTYNANTNEIIAYGAFTETPSAGEFAATIIDADTLTVKSTKNLIEAQAYNANYALTYSPDNDRYYAFPSFNMSFDSTNSRVVVYGASFNYIETYDIEMRFGFTISACGAGGGHIWVIGNNPLKLFEFSLDMKIETVYELNSIVGNYRKVTEIESCEYVDGDIILGCMYQSAGFADIASFVKIPFTSGDSKSSIARSEFSEKCTVYVNNANTSYDRDGTEDNPFHAITEALNCGYCCNYLRIVDNSTDDNVVHQFFYEGNATLLYSNANSTPASRMCYQVNLSSCDVSFLGIRIGVYSSGSALTSYSSRIVLDGTYKPDTVTLGTVLNLDGNTSIEVTNPIFDDTGVYANIDKLIGFMSNGCSITAKTPYQLSFAKTVFLSSVANTNLCRWPGIHSFFGNYNASTWDNIADKPTKDNFYAPLRATLLVFYSISGTSYATTFEPLGLSDTKVCANGSDYITVAEGRDGYWGHYTVTHSSNVTIDNVFIYTL